MSKHTMNYILPFEILKNIFQYVNRTCQDKEDIKTCLSVCKSWQVAAEDVYELSIKVDEEALDKLSKDIIYFSQKVKSITLRENESTTIDRTGTSLIWFDIIFACPNLTSIIIRVSDDSKYVRYLMDTTRRFDHIQYFETPTLQHHLQLNLKHHKTITSLLVTSLECCSSVKSSDNELAYYISLFPKLTSLKVKPPLRVPVSGEGTIDIIQLLEAAPQLRSFYVGSICVGIRSSSITTVADNLCLNSLTLRVSNMHINSVRFIVTRLKRLHYLKLYTGDLIVDRDETKEEVVEELFDDLKKFTSDIPEFRIHFVFRFDLYILENGKEPFKRDLFPGEEYYR